MVSRKNIEPKLDVNLGFVESGADYTNILDILNIYFTTIASDIAFILAHS